MRKIIINKKKRRTYIIGCICVFLAVAYLGNIVFADNNKVTVYAVDSEGNEQLDNHAFAHTELQAGLMGLVGGVEAMADYTRSMELVDAVNAASKSEEVLVGSGKIKKTAVTREAVQNSLGAIGNVGYYAMETIRSNHTISATDYFTLLQIVEAEATGGDIKSKILIANVVMNRVKDGHFPDNIYDVVWQRAGGAAQFSPTEDGRISTVEITQDTIDAVDLALAGEDYSEGALFFVARTSADQNNVQWFDESLEPMFSYGGHEYFKFKE